MLAVLNRYFDHNLVEKISNDRLHAQLGDRQLPLTDRWGMIARDYVIASWEHFPPNFNNNKTIISLENICHGFGRKKFNKLVETMLGEFDFFDTWIGNNEE